MKLLYGVAFLLISALNPSETTVIRIKDGRIRGTTSFTRNSRSFYAFKGIPFAKPPLDNLRFKDPVPPTPWGWNILDTIKDAPKCIQADTFRVLDASVEGEEDCLYLNVYTPRLCSTSNKKLPVMVYIHYGGFFSGSGRSDYAGPEYFLDRDIILVTLNYRLGVLGFLSFGDDNAAGNWGMKDQSLGLQWVQDNIKFFGGDKHQVTIFGESAGSGSCHLHMFSPLSKGLFHRAISQSGNALSIWARPNTLLQTQIARIQASFVGCNINATNDIISCLRKVPGRVLVESSKRFRVFIGEPSIIYGLVTEKKTRLNPRPFLEDDPFDLLRTGQFNPVPWICGVTEKEGLVKAGYLLRNDNYKNLLLQNFPENLPTLLGLSASTTDVPTLYNKIIDFYLHNDTQLSTENSVEAFVDMVSDRYIIYSAYQASLLQAMKTKVPVWVYRYNYKSELTYTDIYSYSSNPTVGTLGVCHTDDLIPLFYSPAVFNRSISSVNDLVMSHIMIKMWTSFATSGNPSSNNMFMNFKWKPLTNLYGKPTAGPADLWYLFMQGPNVDYPVKLEMRNDFFKDRMRFWNNVDISEHIPEIA